MTKSVTLQVSDDVGITIEIYFETSSKRFSGRVFPFEPCDNYDHGLADSVFCRVGRVWDRQNRSVPAGGANIVDSLTRSVIDLYSLIRISGATDPVRDLRYEQVYSLLDAYFLMAVSEEVATRDESQLLGSQH